MGPFDRLTAGMRNVLSVQSGLATRSRRRSRSANCRSANCGVEALEGRALLAVSPLMNPAAIEKLAAAAYVWGLAPEFDERFSTYNSIVGAPLNTLQYGSVPAAWNNAATNAGDSSVLYINSFTDFAKTSALVLTVPASSSQYYVVDYIDNCMNTVGSIGTRTTPSDGPTSYLLVGPNSPYARDRTVKIDGFQYRVLSSDSNLNWMLIRVACNTLAAPSSPQSVSSVYSNVVQKFTLNTLAQFQANGNQPVFPVSYITDTTPTAAQAIEAAPYQNTPTNAVEFFHQLGTSLQTSPLPNRYTALSGTTLKQLPSWVVPQYGATNRYLVPSYGQAAILRSFAAIGLTPRGFQVPRNWGAVQLQALQTGFVDGQNYVKQKIDDAGASATANYWAILSNIVGTYPNNEEGYTLRSAIVDEGGSANIALDAVYPATTEIATSQATALLNGNNTYSITFMPPTSYTSGQPVYGTYPPEVTNSSGNPKGFWSITLYQPDSTETAAPFLSQSSVLNTYLLERR